MRFNSIWALYELTHAFFLNSSTWRTTSNQSSKKRQTRYSPKSTHLISLNSSISSNILVTSLSSSSKTQRLIRTQWTKQLFKCISMFSIDFSINSTSHETFLKSIFDWLRRQRHMKINMEQIWTWTNSVRFWAPSITSLNSLRTKSETQVFVILDFLSH